MQSTKCWAPPSRRSSRSTEVTTTYFRPMSATVCARLQRLAGIRRLRPAVGDVAEQQRRVQTSPRIMKVAVPWLKHSWMFGQLASSQTVTRRFSRSLALSRGDRAVGWGCARGSTTACAAPARRRTAPASARSCRRRPASRPASSDGAVGDDLQGNRAWRGSDIGVTAQAACVRKACADGDGAAGLGEVGRRRRVQRQAELRAPARPAAPA